MIGLRAHKGRQERVVDVDDVVRVLCYHLVGDDLHIACQHNERDVFFSQQFQLCLFHLGFVGVVFLDAPHIVGNAELLCHIAQVFVVGHDAGHLAGKLAGLPPCQQVVQAMAHLRHEDGHPGALVAVIERELHLVALGIERGDIFVDLVAWNEEAVEFPFYAHEEHAVLLVHILVQVDDVPFVVGDESGHFCNDALLVRAMQQQYGCLLLSRFCRLVCFHFFLYLINYRLQRYK